MGFIFGLIVGTTVAGGSAAVPPSINSIPFRCLAAFESSELEYRSCRWPSLRRELGDSPCGRIDIEKPDGPCSLDKHIAWEIAALRELKKAIETQGKK